MLKLQISYKIVWALCRKDGSTPWEHAVTDVVKMLQIAKHRNPFEEKFHYLGQIFRIKMRGLI